MKRILLLCVVALLLTACTKKEEEIKMNEMNTDFVGKWSGNIEIPNTPLPIIVELTKDAGTLSVPAQGLKYLPFQSITYDGDKVNISIDLKGMLIKITGELKDEEIKATFTQNGGTFPLTLTRYEEQPVTYETISIPVENGDLKIALEKPTEEKPSPVALIIAGSGPTDKDGNSVIGGKNDSYKMLAEELAKEGIATIRYDKRGVGDNTELFTKEEDVSFELFVDDAVQIIQYLQSNDAFTSVHVIGHSEGSLIGMLAAQKTDVDSFVSLAGAGRAIDELLLEQLAGQLSPALTTEAKNALAILKKGELVEKVSPELQGLFRPSVQPYMISWLKYNPASIIQKLEKRTLIVQGTNDIQVTVTDAEILKKAKKDATLLNVEGMNHVLKDAPTDRAGNLATYANPKLPLHPELLPAISDFIKNDQ
ncbi:alpha/beta hydrolase [Lysinibacillus sp. NPDC096418]|uniref:alpha/beta hydrolase n=1 Tax=Lysinibacillus sp. NPDC096418 TaxID=3364138 RepID=UPI0037F1E9E4